MSLDMNILVGFELSGIDPYVAIAACLFRSLLCYCRTAGLLDYLVTGAEFLHFTETMFVNCGYILLSIFIKNLNENLNDPWG